MTNNTKMREAMIDQDGAVWEKIGGAWSLYKPTVPVMGDDIPQDWKGVDGAVAWHLMDRHGEGWAHIGQMMDEWAAANAAQTVPVVGEPIYWIDPDDDANLSRIGRVGWSPLYGESPAYIPAAELATLREKAAEADELRKALLALKEDCQTSNDCQYGTLSTSHVARIVDAAIAQEPKK